MSRKEKDIIGEKVAGMGSFYLYAGLIIIFLPLVILWYSYKYVKKKGMKYILTEIKDTMKMTYKVIILPIAVVFIPAWLLLNFSDGQAGLLHKTIIFTFAGAAFILFLRNGYIYWWKANLTKEEI